MKKWIVALSICTFVTCATLTIPIAVAEPTVRLPSSYVKILAEYGYVSDNYFDITVSDVPPGYDITDGTYHGWCVQRSIEMTRGVNHTVTLRSSLEDDLPNGFDEIPWNEINYIINHRQGNRISVQRAIWNFTDNENVSSDPDALAMVNDAKQNGPNYVPQSGEILAIPMVGTPTIQLAFLELVIPIPSDFQGLVWYDTNADGLQGENEPGISDVTVRLYYNNDTLLQTTTTNTQGYYTYTDVLPGEYYLQFSLKSKHKFTIKDVGSDDTLDSDADPTTGKTVVFTVTANESITKWDAGMYIESSGGTPSPPEVTPTNRRPTADATAGEPYRGFINSTITFNGSRSYDLDGRIISWRWIFGDGKNGTGETTTHSYTAIGNYTVSLLVMDDDFATDMYTTHALITLGNNPPGSPVITGPLSGHTAGSYQYTVVAVDPDGDNLKYFIDWGDNTKDVTEFKGSGVSVELSHQWNTPGFYVVQAYAQDVYDEISVIYKTTVSIDVIYVGDLGYCIDENGDGIFEKFHNNATGLETTMSQQPDGSYLIDTDGDGQWDIVYNSTSGQTSDYNEQPFIQYAVILLAVLIIVSILIYFIVRSRRRSRTLGKNQNSERRQP